MFRSSFNDVLGASCSRSGAGLAAEGFGYARGVPRRRGVAATPSPGGGTSASMEVAEDDVEASKKAAT